MTERKIELGELVVAVRGPFVHASKEFTLTMREHRNGKWELVPQVLKGNREVKWILNEMLYKTMNATDRRTAITYYPIWLASRWPSYRRYTPDHTDDALKAIARFREIVKGSGIRVKVAFGNDAPRGGMLGKYITATIYLPKTEAEKNNGK